MLLISLAINLFNILKVNTLECVSAINQKCMSRPKIIDLNKDDPVFYPLGIKVNKCSGNCNNINDPMAKLCVPDIVRDMNVKVFNLLARINETRKIVWHETCICICRLTSAVCDDKQEWSKTKCICERKEDLIGKLTCDKGYMWNPSTCSCECGKYCETGQYLDYKNCVCRKKIVDELIEQCTTIIDVEIKNNTAKVNNKESFNVYIISFVVILILSFLFSVGFIYYWHKNSDEKVTKEIYDTTYLNTGTLNH